MLTRTELENYLDGHEDYKRVPSTNSNVSFEVLSARRGELKMYRIVSDLETWMGYSHDWDKMHGYAISLSALRIDSLGNLVETRTIIEAPKC